MEQEKEKKRIKKMQTVTTTEDAKKAYIRLLAARDVVKGEGHQEDAAMLESQALAAQNFIRSQQKRTHFEDLVDQKLEGIVLEALANLPQVTEGEERLTNPTQNTGEYKMDNGTQVASNFSVENYTPGLKGKDFKNYQEFCNYRALGFQKKATEWAGKGEDWKSGKSGAKRLQTKLGRMKGEMAKLFEELRANGVDPETIEAVEPKAKKDAEEKSDAK